MFWGSNPAESHPRHFTKYSLMPKGMFTPNGRKDRTCVIVDVRRTKSAKAADIFLQIKPRKDFEALWTLRALAKGVELDPEVVQQETGIELAVWQDLMERMKAGVTVGELLDASAVTGMDGRGVARLTMHGRGTGDDGPLVTSRITPALRAVELQEGCVMVLKPSASVDGKPDYGRWGESVVVRRDDAERLGSRPQGLLELL